MLIGVGALLTSSGFCALAGIPLMAVGGLILAISSGLSARDAYAKAETGGKDTGRAVLMASLEIGKGILLGGLGFAAGYFAPSVGHLLPAIAHPGSIAGFHITQSMIGGVAIAGGLLSLGVVLYNGIKNKKAQHHNAPIEAAETSSLLRGPPTERRDLAKEFMPEGKASNHGENGISSLPLAQILGTGRIIKINLREETYSVGKCLGNGESGTVKLVSNDSGDNFAMKIMNLSGANDAASVANEIDIMKKLHHPSIVSYHDACKNGDNVYLLIQYADGQDLAARTGNGARPLRTKEFESFLKNVVGAVAYMHKEGISHGDLKLENVMCKKDLSEFWVTDFGTAKISKNDINMGTTIGHIPPEAYAYKYPAMDAQPPPPDASEKAAVWQLCALLSHARWGRPIFPKENPDQLMENPETDLFQAYNHFLYEASLLTIASAKAQRRMGDGGIDALIIDGLSEEPGKRPTMQELVNELGED